MKYRIHIEYIYIRRVLLLLYNITEVGKEIICGFAIIVFAVGILKVVISFLASPINVVCLSVGTQAVVVCL